MNITKSIAVIALTGLLFVSCKNNTEEAPKKTAKIETEAPKIQKKSLLKTYKPPIFLSPE